MGHSDATMIMRIYDEVRDNRSKSQAEMLLKTAFRSGNGSAEESERSETIEK